MNSFEVNLKEQVQTCETKFRELNESLQESLVNVDVGQREVKSCQEEIKKLQNKLKESKISHEKFIGNGSKMVFNTGLTIGQFNALWKFLEPELCTPKRNGISQKNELFVVLGLHYKDLADR